MSKRYIRVKVDRGVFPGERTASFSAGGRSYSLIVDNGDIENDKLAVLVLGEQGDDVLVALPRETFTTGSRLRVPKAILEPVG
ncbi:MAG TPA: hypothetical protein VGN26_08710 [Armatimonadota bacterium]|jgi:hypothetical protein